MFTLIIEDKHGGIADEYSFEEGEFYVGRSHTSDIILPSDNVSRRHARLYTVDGRCYIEDLNSSNGVFVNGRRIHEVYQIQRSAQVKVGDYYLHIESDDDDPGREEDRTYCRLVGRNLAFANQVFRVQRKVNLIGRGKDCGITIIDASVSRIHAKLTVERSGAMTLEDLKSSNGTFVDDERVEIVTLNHGDVVRLGNIEFLLEIPDAAPAPARAERAAPARRSTGSSEPMAIPGASPAPPPAPAPSEPQLPIAQDDGRFSTVGVMYTEDWEPKPHRRRGFWLAAAIVGGVLIAGGLTLALLSDDIFGEGGDFPAAYVEPSLSIAPEDLRRDAERAAADELFREAIPLGLEEERWEVAVDKLERVVALAPAHTEARGQLNAFKDYREDAAQLAEARELANDVKRGAAATLLRRVIEDRTSPYRERAQADLDNLMGYKPMMLTVAENKLRQRACADALEQLEEVQALDPKDLKILTLIQDVKSRQGTRRCRD